MAVLDELDELADLLAAEAGQPRSEALLAELLPSVGGLHGLASDGPGVLADRRLGPVPALRAGRRSTLVQAPLGVVGVHVRDGSPWAGPLLEVAAALLAGNAVLLAPAAPLAAARMQAAFISAALRRSCSSSRRKRTSPAPRASSRSTRRRPRARCSCSTGRRWIAPSQARSGPRSPVVGAGTRRSGG